MAKSHTHNADTTRWFFILLSAVTLGIFLYIIHSFLLTLVTAAVFAVVLSPVDHLLSRKIKNRWASAAIVVVGVLILIVIPLSAAITVMISQANDIVQSATGEQGWLETFDAQTNPFIMSLPESIQAEVLAFDLVQAGKDAAAWFARELPRIASKTGEALLQIFVFFVALFYLIVDRQKIYSELLKLSPFDDTLDREILNRIISTVRGVVFGALIIAVVQGVLATIGMTIFGVPGAMIWGAVAVVAAEIPLLGVSLVMLPAVAYLFFTGSTSMAIGLLIWSVIVVGLADNVLAPKLISGKTHMHTLLILISILGGLSVFGPVGFIIGPTVLAAVMVITELYKSGVLAKKRS